MKTIVEILKNDQGIGAKSNKKTLTVIKNCHKERNEGKFKPMGQMGFLDPHSIAARILQRNNALLSGQSDASDNQMLRAESAQMPYDQQHSSKRGKGQVQRYEKIQIE